MQEPSILKRVKSVCAVCLLGVMLVLTGCRKPVGSTPDECSTVDSVQPSQSQTESVYSATETSTEPVTEAVTEPSTEAPTEYEFRWIGSDPNDRYDATGFVSVSTVIPDVILDMRYYSDYNFVGTQINGYEEPVALLSEEAAYALRNAADMLRAQGYLIKIYDAYRPQRAVEHFASWASDWSDTKMKEDFYPSLDKSVLFDYGYIAYYSGHSRGSKVDITLVDAASGKELDMGGTFDYFDVRSHPDYTGITSEQYQNRMILREVMLNNGFYPCSTEWWDFTLNNEPYPSTYFDFPVSLSSLNLN